ncbi:XkdX family protein [Anaerotruncus rubiinfantis]|uniref:XkdX family protein n=1 Tax=Anaerotruncus rubiinfantis TaxID=1720200 RepID=UPI003D78D4E4
MTYEIIKKNFDRKLWDAGMVAVAVAKGKITEVQYQEITGEVYTGANVPTTMAQTVQTHDDALNALAGVE